MMKFFRKHNKKLLAIFMVLLMVVFLGGSALSSLLAPSVNRVVAESKLGTISFLDQRVAESTTQILSSLLIDWQRPIPGVVEPLDLIDWILLTREANQLGMGSNLTSVRSTLGDPSTIDEQSRRLRIKPSRILEALAQFAAVQQTALVVAGAITPSAAEVAATARKALETVRIRAVVLPAEAFVGQEDSTFSDDEVEAQFEAYRNRERGEGLAFGYYVPPAVKVQYVKIDRDAVAAQVRVPNIERKAKAFYDEQRERNPAFRRPPEEADAGGEQAEKDTEGPPAPKPTPYLTWEEARDKALDIVRKREADEAVSRMADWLIQYAAEPWLDIERGDDGYKQAPEPVTHADFYETILEKMPATIAYPDAVSTDTTDFFTEDEAERVPGIGGAFFIGRRAGEWASLKTLAFRTKAIVPKVPEARETNPSDYLAAYQTCRFVLKDGNGNAYVFRVVEVRSGHTPDSIDEVRDKVLADLRLLRAYEDAKARAESLRGCGASMSLQEAYESDEELVTLIESQGLFGAGFLEPPPFARMVRYFAAKGDTERETAIGAGIGKVPVSVADRLFALEYAENPITIIELKSRAAVMVAEWVETQHAQADEFDEQQQALLDEMIRYRGQDAVGAWLKPDNIRARNQFALVTSQ